MNPIEERDKTNESTTVFPALIQVPGMHSVLPAPKSGKRRISALLDHRVARQLGMFSWLLIILALAARRPITAVLVGAVIFLGLVIGFINAARWLFEKR
jgi:hypothetical protein